MINIVFHNIKSMKNSITLFLIFAITMPLTLFLCLAISCQQKTNDKIVEKEAAKSAAGISIESSRVGGVGLPNRPKLIKKVDPVYPEIAKESKVEGCVILEVTTDINGEVQRAKVLRSIPLLDQAAIDAVRQWVFEPVIIDGQRKGVILTVSVEFRLK